VTSDVLILIPAYDAQSAIGRIVRECIALGFQVVVVDDGSRDATGAAASAAGAQVLAHQVNRGKGAALRSGFRHAIDLGYRAVITLDADGQHLPSCIPRLVEAWRTTGAELVIGSRRHLFAGMVRRRRMANVFSAATISFAAGTRVTDPQSGFRLYTANLLKEIPTVGERFDAESEIIVRAARLGMRIEEVPIELGFVDGLATSHYRAVTDTLRIAWRVTLTRFGRKR
jgi:glycosyltransferase involved in cell wall biosynthesis